MGWVVIFDKKPLDTIYIGYHNHRIMVKSVNAAHILVNKEDDARKIMDRLEKGEDFEALAKRFSKCPSGKKGGNLGWFGKGDMVKEFDEACFNGKKGDVIGPVKTEFGYHVILIKDQK